MLMARRENILGVAPRCQALRHRLHPALDTKILTKNLCDPWGPGVRLLAGMDEIQN